MTTFLTTLESILQARKEDLPEESYVSNLFKLGDDRILKKIAEEAGEVIIAGKNNDKTELLNESADLLFHLLVYLTHKGYSIKDVVSVLKDRHQIKS